MTRSQNRLSLSERGAERSQIPRTRSSLFTFAMVGPPVSARVWWLGRAVGRGSRRRPCRRPKRRLRSAGVVGLVHAGGDEQPGRGGERGDDGGGGTGAGCGGEEGGDERADGEAAVAPQPVDADGAGAPG